MSPAASARSHWRRVDVQPPRRSDVARFGLLLVIGLAAFGACATASGGTGLTVFVAASLNPVMEDIEEAWLADHPDLPLTVSTAASNQLSAQIEAGADADVFMSADTTRPQELAEGGLTAAEPRPFVRNRLVLVAPLADDRVQEPADLAEPGVRLIGTLAAAPIGAYTATALAALAATMPDPGAFAAAVEDNTVSLEENVRAALAKVELAEGDAGFVYRTDALGSDAVRVVPLPASVDVAADYAVVQVSDTAGAAEFVDWLSTPAAAAVFEAAGFEVVS